LPIDDGDKVECLFAEEAIQGAAVTPGTSALITAAQWMKCVTANNSSTSLFALSIVNLVQKMMLAWRVLLLGRKALTAMVQKVHSATFGYNLLQVDAFRFAV